MDRVAAFPSVDIVTVVRVILTDVESIGDIVAAFFYNPFLLLLVLPIVTLYAIAYLIPHGKATRFKAIVYHPILILLIIVVAHLWWVFRNTELWLNIVAEYS